MSNRTPGPWRLTYSNCWIVGRDETKGDVVIAETKAGTLADAQLIAAAPDLLAALKDLINPIYQSYGRPDHVRVANALAAIAKATGGSHADL